MAYQELIKDINKIREYLRNFYVYGFYTREEYARLFRMSARSYDNERRRVESWMGEYVNFHQNAEGRKVFLSAAGNSILSNPLYRAFKAKSFTTNDILLHFFLMDLLSVRGEIDQKEAADLLEEEYPDVFGSVILPDEKTVRLKLKELEKLGLVSSQKCGRSLKYQLTSSDIDLELSGIWQAVSFYSEAAPLGVIGSFLLDKEICTEREKHCFRFRHHYLMHAIDSGILGEILLAINEKRGIRIRVDSPFQGSHQYECVPLKIYVSTQHGREYLLSWNSSRKRFYFSRLDRIVWTEQLEPVVEWEDLEKNFAELKDHLWGVSFGGLDEISNLCHIEMEIRADETEAFIPERLEREKRCGSVRKTGKDRYLFAADVFDAMELFPWICSFTGRILRIRCDDREVPEKYREYLSQMSVNYGLLETGGSAAGKKTDHSETKSENDETVSETKTENRKTGNRVQIFHEVYGVYYNAVARVLGRAVRGELTPGTLMQVIQKEAFGESGMYLPDRLLSGEWPFLTEDLKTCIKKEPVMPLTLIQKRWLKSLLGDPKIHLFLKEDVCRQLAGELQDIQPLFAPDTFCCYDRFLDGDPFEKAEYISHFQTVLKAIREKTGLALSYENRHGIRQSLNVIPQTIEYSAREDKFRFYAVNAEKTEWKEPLRLNMNRIISCEPVPVRETEMRESGIGSDSAVIEFEDTENTLERMMLQFSFLEKKTERLKNGRFRTTIYYPEADKTEILIRILSFGQQVRILSEGYLKEETEKRLVCQMKLFEGTGDGSLSLS